MKTIKTHLKEVAIILSTILMLYNCAASYQGSYTLMDTLNTNRIVKIIKVNNTEFVYQNIDTLNGAWIGEKRISGNKIVYETIDPKNITKIQLGRTKESQSKEGLVVVGVILGIGLLIFGISNMSIDLSGGD